MPMPPAHPKIYHIVHVDRLPSIIEDSHLWCDAVIMGRANTGTGIGMAAIKERRLRLALDCHPGLLVGECVPFYFCPRSVMLYLIWRGNHPDLTFRGGQPPIVHLESDLRATVAWAEQQNLRWAFTLSNAGSYYFEDRCDLTQLPDVNWEAVAASWWQGELEDGKQAEFLLEERFPWELVERVGVHSNGIAHQVRQAMQRAAHKPRVEIKADWYY